MRPRERTLRLAADDAANRIIRKLLCRAAVECKHPDVQRSKRSARRDGGITHDERVPKFRRCLPFWFRIFGHVGNGSTVGTPGELFNAFRRVADGTRVTTVEP